MNLLVLDFESFFDQEYSLSKMTTEAYVRDPRFKAHMLGYWIPSKMPAPANLSPALLQQDDVRRLIEESAVLCHHAHFDGLILSHHYGLRPKMWLDTLSMSRLVWPKLKSHSLDALVLACGLPSKHVPYHLFKGVPDLWGELYAQVAAGCEWDCHLTYEIFKRLAPHVPREELTVIDATVRMFTEPVLELDRPRMEKFLLEERVRKAKVMLAAGQVILGSTPYPTREGIIQYLAAVETELQSSDKFKLALEALGYECPMKWSVKQEKEIPALAKNDSGMEELLEHDDSRVQTLAAARLGVKSTIDETRAERLLDSAGRGALPVYLSYAAAKTLRFGGGDKCLAADTQVTVFDLKKGLAQKCIVDVLLDDLVWDGTEFVEHDGVVFQGYREVITYDGVCGTVSHPVCVKGKTTSLSEAMRRRARILDCPKPTSRDVDRAQLRAKGKARLDGKM